MIKNIEEDKYYLSNSGLIIGPIGKSYAYSGGFYSDFFRYNDRPQDGPQTCRTYWTSAGEAVEGQDHLICEFDVLNWRPVSIKTNTKTCTCGASSVMGPSSLTLRHSDWCDDKK